MGDPGDPSDVAKWLDMILANGPQPASAIQTLACRYEIGGDALEQAAKLIGVDRFGFKRRFWRKPPATRIRAGR